MSKFVQNLGVKITAFLLLTVLIFSLFVAVIGIYVLTESNVYVDDGEQFISDIYESYAYSKLPRVEVFLNNKFGGYDVTSLEAHLEPEYTNIRYTAIDDKGIVQGTNMTGNEVLYNTEETQITCFVPNDDTINIHYAVFQDYVSLNDYINRFEDHTKKIVSTEIGENEISENASGDILLKIRYQYGDYRVITITFGALKEPVKKDSLYFKLNLARFGISVKETVFVYVAAVLILCIFLLVVLLCGAGHKKGVDGIYLSKFNRIPFDLYLAINGVAAFIILECVFESFYSDLSAIIGLCVAVPLLTAMVLGIVLTFAARVKTDGWYKNTWIFVCLKWLWTAVKFIFKGIFYLVKKIPLFYKTLLLIAGITFFEILFFAFGFEDYIFLWILEKLVFVPLTVYAVLCMRYLQKSAREMARGNSEYKTDTRYMILDFKEHGENLNGIGNGLVLAVEKSVRSERMKAELITNVSHDIKTPLTSIINYVDLLKREGLDSENAGEYLEVLDRQSNRLKRLTEDLVEASKASTGNVSINREKVDMNVLLTQTAGEYEERFVEKELELILDKTEDELIVNADGRHIWRVFDNLMNNICKYAQPKTRVYISSKHENERAVIVFRNISKEPLNIDPEELTERFVRGDKSRNTEGSGLGLSIARSLTELQGGEFNIQIDGDLFKVTIKL